VTPVIYLSGPYPGHRELPPETILATATMYYKAAEAAGWVPVCPSLYPDPNPWKQGESMLNRMDPAEGDAVLMLPDWMRDQRAVTEHRRASSRGLKIYAVRGDQPIPTPEEHMLCPHYRTVHYEISDRDTCNADTRQCPPGVRCPIVEKMQRRRIR